MIKNALASVAVEEPRSIRGLVRTCAGYGRTPAMAEVVEWQFDGGGPAGLRAAGARGSGSFTAFVVGVDTVAARLDELGIKHPPGAHGERVDTLMITDPDGNHVAFAAAHDSSLAS